MANTSRNTSARRVSRDNTEVQGAGVGNLGDQMSDQQKAALTNMPATPAEEVKEELAERSILVPVTSPGIGTNNPPTRDQVIKEEILAYYKPVKPLNEAKADAIETVRFIQDRTNDIEGTAIGRLTMDFADIAFANVNCTPQQLGVSKDMDKNLIKLLKDKVYLGEATQIKDTKETGLVEIVNEFENPETKEKEIVNTNTGAVVDIVSPYAGVNAAYIARASKQACLIVYGVKTRVQWGFVHKSECSGRRIHKGLTFLPENKIEADKIDDYFRVCCVPNNVVSPVSYATRLSDDMQELLPGSPSGNNSLRALTDDWAYALYQHHFHGEGLWFDVGPAKTMPTGLLLKKRPEARVAQQRVTVSETYKEPESLDEAKSVIKRRDAELNIARKTAIGDLGMIGPQLEESMTALCVALTPAPNMKPPGLTPAAMASLIRACHTMIHYQLGSYVGHKLPKEVRKELPMLDKMLHASFRWDFDKGEYQWLDKDGSTIIDVIDD